VLCACVCLLFVDVTVLACYACACLYFVDVTVLPRCGCVCVCLFFVDVTVFACVCVCMTRVSPAAGDTHT